MTAHILDNCKEASSFVSLSLREPVRIRFEEGERLPITVPQLFEQTVQKLPNNPALVSRNQDRQWVTLSYQDYWDKSRQFARAFIRLGFEPRTSCGILAVGCPEWFLAQMASIMAGGVSAGIYMTNSAEACHHILDQSSATVCVVDDSAQMTKIRSIKHRLPLLKAIIQINAPFEDFVDTEEGYYSWSKVAAMGESDEHLEQQLQARLNDIVANECALLIYTSGTTGMPKGVMLTHDNIIIMSERLFDGCEDKVYGHEVIVSYLPLNHVGGQVMDFFNSLLLGACVYFADRNALKGSLLTTLIEAKPTRFFGVPRIYEKIAEKLTASEHQMSWITRVLVTASRKVMKNYNLSLTENTDGTKRSNALANFFASRIIQRVRAAAGFDQCKNYFVGAAVCEIELKELLLGYDMQLIETYGLSEASGSVTLNWEREEYVSCGRAIPGVELKLANPDHNGHGELCVRGRTVFMGYLGDKEQTSEALTDDGWLRTGDIGFLDVKGRLHITGRLKELIVTSGGENIPPLHIESLVKHELPGISNAFLVGDKRKFLTMLLTLKTEVDKSTGAPGDRLQEDALEWMHSLNVPYTTLSEVLNAGPCPVVMLSIEEAIDRVNADAISNAQRVRKFAILPQDFSVQAGELGPTLKLRRKVVLKKYADVIESFYRGA